MKTSCGRGAPDGGGEAAWNSWLSGQTGRQAGCLPLTPLPTKTRAAAVLVSASTRPSCSPGASPQHRPGSARTSYCCGSAPNSASSSRRTASTACEARMEDGVTECGLPYAVDPSSCGRRERPGAGWSLSQRLSGRASSSASTVRAPHLPVCPLCCLAGSASGSLKDWLGPCQPHPTACAVPSPVAQPRRPAARSLCLQLAPSLKLAHVQSSCNAAHQPTRARASIWELR